MTDARAQERDDDPLVELGRLRHRQAAAFRRRERLLERVAWFPNEVNSRTLEQLDGEQRLIEARIRELELRVDGG